MKPHAFEQTGQAYRDGLLTDAERESFEAYLAEHPEEAARFARETQWLKMLGEPRLPRQVPGAPSFTNQVLDRWETERALGIGTGFRWRAALFSGAWAAAAVIVASVMWKTQEPPPVEQDAPVAMNPGFYPDMMGERTGHRSAHPITVLVREMNEQFVDRPNEARHLWDEARYWADISRLGELAEAASAKRVHHVDP